MLRVFALAIATLLGLCASMARAEEDPKLICRGGPGMRLLLEHVSRKYGYEQSVVALRVSFKRATRAGQDQSPAEGYCTLLNAAIRDSQPDSFWIVQQADQISIQFNGDGALGTSQIGGRAHAIRASNDIDFVVDRIRQRDSFTMTVREIKSIIYDHPTGPPAIPRWQVVKVDVTR